MSTVKAAQTGNAAARVKAVEGAPSKRLDTTRLIIGSLRELSTIGVVCALSGSYCAVMISASGILDTVASSEGTSVGAVLDVVSGVFVLIALFVGSIVIGNAVATVIAGRQKQLAMLRLLGASSAQLRLGIVRAVATVATIGAAVGTVVGTVLTDTARSVLVLNGTLPRAEYDWARPHLMAGLAAVVLAAVIAAYSGSRAVLAATPGRASGEASESIAVQRGSRLRLVISTAVIGVGALLLVGASVAGESGGAGGFLLAFFGAAVTSTGLLIGARLIVPRLVSLFGAALGSDTAATVARRNAVTDPMRTTRSTMGILIGVTLITTIASGMSALRQSVSTWPDMTPDRIASVDRLLSLTGTVLVIIVAISAIVSAVGFVSTMSLTVLGRTREIGLLRTLGLTRAQVKTMIAKESVALSGTATVFGIVLGIVFGAVGAQSLLGAFSDGVALGLPWGTIGVVVLCAAVVVYLSSAAPSRRAVAVSPVDAMAHA